MFIPQPNIFHFLWRFFTLISRIWGIKGSANSQEPFWLFWEYVKYKKRGKKKKNQNASLPRRKNKHRQTLEHFVFFSLNDTCVCCWSTRIYKRKGSRGKVWVAIFCCEEISEWFLDSKISFVFCERQKDRNVVGKMKVLHLFRNKINNLCTRQIMRIRILFH